MSAIQQKDFEKFTIETPKTKSNKSVELFEEFKYSPKSKPDAWIRKKGLKNKSICSNQSLKTINYIENSKKIRSYS